MNPQFCAGSSNKGGAYSSRVRACTLLWSRCAFKVETLQGLSKLQQS